MKSRFYEEEAAARQASREAEEARRLGRREEESVIGYVESLFSSKQRGHRRVGSLRAEAAGGGDGAVEGRSRSPSLGGIFTRDESREGSPRQGRSRASSLFARAEALDFRFVEEMLEGGLERKVDKIVEEQLEKWSRMLSNSL